MAIQYDARANEFRGNLDAITGGTITDARTLTASLGALNAESLMDLNGDGAASFDIRTAAASLTIVWEATVDGTNYFALAALDNATGAEVWVSTVVITTTLAKTYLVRICGYKRIRVRVSAYVSGSVTVATRATIQDMDMTGAHDAVGTSQNPVAAGGYASAAAPSDVSADGDIVRAWNLRNGARVVQPTFAGVLQSTGAAGVPKVAIVGNAGANLDAVSGAAVPPNAQLIAGGSIAGGTNLTPLTVKAASTAAAATDTAVVVQALVNNAVMVTAAAGVQKVGVVGNAGAIFDGATGAAVPANAILKGLRAATANPTNATGGNSVAAMGDKAGRMVTTPGNVRELVAIQTTTITASTAETTIITAAGASVFADLSSLIITSTDVVAATITIKDATAGTTRMIIDYPPTAAAVQPFVCNFTIPVPQAASNNNWTATVSVNAGSVHITAVYIKNL